MSDKSKIENEVAELKSLLSDAEHRLMQLEADQAALKAKHGAKGFLKLVKKTLIMAALLVITVKGGKILYHRRSHKRIG